MVPGSCWGGPRPTPSPTHREVPDTERVLQETLEGHGPAGDPPVTQAPAALHAGEAGIAAQAVVAHTVLPVGAAQLCGDQHTPHLHACPGARPAFPEATGVSQGSSRAHATSANRIPSAVLGAGRAWDRTKPTTRTHSAGRTVSITTHDKAAHHKAGTQQGASRGPCVRLGGAGSQGEQSEGAGLWTLSGAGLSVKGPLLMSTCEYFGTCVSVTTQPEATWM